MKKQKIKLIIFDAYGVILTGGYPPTMRIFAKMFHKNWRDLYAAFYTKYFNLAAEGKIKESDAWKKPIACFGFKMPWTKALKIHLDRMAVNKRNLGLAKRLSLKFKTLLLTKNTPIQFKEIVFRRFKLNNYFRFIINTYDLKLPKAGRKTYQYLMKKFKVQAKEIFYVDDQDSNLVEAKKMGIHTHLYKNYKFFRKELIKHQIL